MNNKILAIALSVIAIIVVIYQIFLREDDNKISKNNQNQFVKTVSAQNTQPIIKENLDLSDNNKNDLNNSMIIDLYSPLLLKKVKPYVKNKNKELINSYGTNIFGYKKKIIEKYSQKETKQKTPVLKLDGIVELIKDKIIIAIINNKLYKKGEMIMNATILKIEKDKVILKFNKETIILTVNHGSYKGWIQNNGGNL